MSPRDATLLPPLDPGKPKQLAGFEKMHFGAFFDRAGRENDYLWGRLDGAERLIGLVLGAGFTDEERAAWCRKAFAAIVGGGEAARSGTPSRCSTTCAASRAARSLALRSRTGQGRAGRDVRVIAKPSRPEYPGDRVFAADRAEGDETPVWPGLAARLTSRSWWRRSR